MKTAYHICPRLAMASLLGSMALLTSACQPDPITPAPTRQMGLVTSPTEQADVYLPTQWTFAVDEANDTTTRYEHRIVKDSEGKFGYLLSAKAVAGAKGTSTGYWKATVPYRVIADVAPGSILRFRAAVRLIDVQGEGACLTIKSGSDSVQVNTRTYLRQPDLFATTRTTIPMQGTSDFLDYTVQLPYSTSVPSLTIYLMLLPGSTGRVIFRDMSLELGQKN